MTEHMSELRDNGPEDDRTSLIVIAADLLTSLRFLLFCTVIGAALGCSLALLRSRKYVATISFVPQSAGSPSAVAGIAAQFGISVDGGNVGSSPEFYAKLLRSRTVSDSILRARYTDPKNGEAVDLVTLLGAQGDDRESLMADARSRLADLTSVKTTAETGIVELSVATKWPTVSQKIADLMLGQVVRFDLVTRQAQAGAERRFVEGRLSEARSALARAEDALASFLRNNREFTAPALAIEHERLMHELSLRQELESVLAQSFEKARIDEVRNTPRIVVIDPPEGSVAPTSKHLLVLCFLSAVIAFVLAAAFTIGISAMRRDRAANPDLYASLSAARKKGLFRK